MLETSLENVKLSENVGKPCRKMSETLSGNACDASAGGPLKLRNQNKSGFTPPLHLQLSESLLESPSRISSFCSTPSLSVSNIRKMKSVSSAVTWVGNSCLI